MHGCSSVDDRAGLDAGSDATSTLVARQVGDAGQRAGQPMVNASASLAGHRVGR